MTDLVLIPCCSRKRSGGKRDESKSMLENYLTPSTWNRLCAARVELANILQLEISSDLDESDTPPKVDLMPAFRRYDGNLYRKAQLSVQELDNSHRLFIVSALYGLLDARDPIRLYNLQMSDTLPGRISVKRWWREKGLIGVVSNVIEHLGPKRLHDLLSGHYRDALRQIPTVTPKNCLYRPYDYPGMGTGSDYHRGSDLHQILGQ